MGSRTYMSTLVIDLSIWVPKYICPSPPCWHSLYHQTSEKILFLFTRVLLKLRWSKFCEVHKIYVLWLTLLVPLHLRNLNRLNRMFKHGSNLQIYGQLVEDIYTLNSDNKSCQHGRIQDYKFGGPKQTI